MAAVLAMPWPHFLTLYEAIAPEESLSGDGAMTVDRALGIQQLYQEHRARRAQISEN